MTDFSSLFRATPEAVTDAHARVNLIGEHTDYNGGYVLPLQMPHRTTVELRSRDDERVRIWSEKKARSGMAEYTLGQESARKSWIDYIQGVTATLQEDGHKIAGFDARIESNIPIGSGISSSAALEVALLRALRMVNKLKISDVDIALIGQRAENGFVGARTGVMDQMVASVGDERSALFLDTSNLHYENIPLPASFELIVINSGIMHSLREGGYNARRAECEEACRLLGVRRLRELKMSDLPKLSSLPEAISRRVRHVITENERVLQAVQALRSNDMERLGRLFYASHWSMRDDYEVSTPQIDLLVELARSEPAVYGARLTGGGFGGAVIILTEKAASKQLAERIASAYFKRTQTKPMILKS